MLTKPAMWHLYNNECYDWSNLEAEDEQFYGPNYKLKEILNKK